MNIGSSGGVMLGCMVRRTMHNNIISCRQGRRFIVVKTVLAMITLQPIRFVTAPSIQLAMSSLMELGASPVWTVAMVTAAVTSMQYLHFDGVRGIL